MTGARAGWPHLAVVVAFGLLAGLRAANVVFPASLEWGVYDVAQARLLPRPAPSDRVVVIELDDSSLEEIGERWPIRRATWAAFFRKLAAYEPSVIAADVVFDQPSPWEDIDLGESMLERMGAAGLLDSEAGAGLAADLRAELARRDDDRILAEALAEAGTVVLGAMLYTDGAVLLDAQDARPRAHPLRVALPARLRSTGTRLVTSHAPLAVSAHANALLNVLVDGDGVVRRYPYAASWAGNAYSSLALAAVTLARPADAVAMHERLTSTDGGAPLLRFPALGQLPRIRFSDILLGPGDAPGTREVLAGRIVLVGVTASGVYEQHSVPTGPSVAGIDIHAAAVENLLTGSYARSEGAPAWVGLLLALALLGGFAFVSARIGRVGLLLAAGFALVAVYLLAAAILFVRSGWLLPVVPVPAGVLALVTVEGGLRFRRLQQSQQVLREQERLTEAYGEFLATVSHELRTPLTSIRGSLRLVRAGASGELPAETRELIDVASTNTERLGRLVDDVLDLQKMDAGHMTLERRPSDLREVVRDGLESTRPFAEGLGVTLALEEAAAPLRVDADPDRIIQVITNLVSNAVKFSPAHGEVRVWAEERGNKVGRVWVEDRGPGIPAELRDRVFERFAQARGSHPMKGTGLGLSIAKAIVDRHGGSIGFETDPARGTKFYFELPLDRPPGRASSSGAED